MTSRVFLFAALIISTLGCGPVSNPQSKTVSTGKREISPTQGEAKETGALTYIILLKDELSPKELDSCEAHLQKLTGELKVLTRGVFISYTATVEEANVDKVRKLDCVGAMEVEVESSTGGVGGVINIQ